MPFASLTAPLRRLGSLWRDLPVRHKGTIVVAIPSACLLITVGHGFGRATLYKKFVKRSIIQRRSFNAAIAC